MVFHICVLIHPIICQTNIFKNKSLHYCCWMFSFAAEYNSRINTISLGEHNLIISSYYVHFCLVNNVIQIKQHSSIIPEFFQQQISLYHCEQNQKCRSIPCSICTCCPQLSWMILSNFNFSLQRTQLKTDIKYEIYSETGLGPCFWWTVY